MLQMPNVKTQGLSSDEGIIRTYISEAEHFRRGVREFSVYFSEENSGLMNTCREYESSRFGVGDTFPCRQGWKEGL